MMDWVHGRRDKHKVRFRIHPSLSAQHLMLMEMCPPEALLPQINEVQLRHKQCRMQ